MYCCRLIVVDESECRGLLAQEAEKLGRLGTSVGVVKDKEDTLRCLLLSGDFRGVLPVDIGLGEGTAVVAAAGGVVSILVEGLAARAGVAWGRGLGLGVSFCLPCCCFARSTIACTRADTGAGDESPRFPIPNRSLPKAMLIKSPEQCSNQGLVDLALSGPCQKHLTPEGF